MGEQKSCWSNNSQIVPNISCLYTTPITKAISLPYFIIALTDFFQLYSFFPTLLYFFFPDSLALILTVQRVDSAFTKIKGQEITGERGMRMFLNRKTKHTRWPWAGAWLLPSLPQQTWPGRHAPAGVGGPVCRGWLGTSRARARLLS